MAEQDDAVAEAARTLYAADPEQFLATRAELAARARADGDAAAAQQIQKLRKPTVAAWIVNALVLADPATVERLGDLGDRLRAAQDRLDAGRLRELTAERRALVDELARQAFGRAGKRQPPAGLRDEVNSTFDAAIAEPEIAARLGRLPRAEQWSGFGFLPSGGPELTLVRGGKGDTDARPPRTPAAPKKSAAQRRREQRAVDDARSALDEAEAAFADAQAQERELGARVKQLTKKLAKVQADLDGARETLETARKDVGTARGRRRDARSALDRAERDARD